MTTWNELKTELNSISTEEMFIIDTLATLYAERLNRGISQKFLANKIGMKQSQLARIEQMDSIPTLTTLNRYANGLGLEIKMTLQPKKIIKV
jgi:transcriptional regulator with XRE-family HTH domain